MNKPLSQWTTKDITDFFHGLDRKSQIRLAVFTVGGLFLAVFILWPAWFARFQVENEILMLRSQIRTAQVKIAQIPKLAEEQKQHEAVVRECRSRLIKEGERESIVGIVAGIAKKSGVVLLSAEPQDLQDPGRKPSPPFDAQYLKITYRVTVEGGYYSLAEFVKEIESHPKILRVEELSIIPKEQTPKVHLGQILVSAFALRGEEKKAGLK